MLKKTAFLITLFLFFFFFLLPVHTQAEPILHITGEVRQALHLTSTAFKNYEWESARLNEVTSDGNFHGVFVYRGPALKTLLESAFVEKKQRDFRKPVDLALRISDKDGRNIVLSWGEVFYRNPADIIVALEGVPVRPHHPTEKIPPAFRPWLKQLDRNVGFPKLVITGDFYTDRCLEKIKSIEVVDLRPVIKGRKGNKLFSPSFTVSGNVSQTLKIQNLSPYEAISVPVKVVGDGKGYHGLKIFGGALLKNILDVAGVHEDLCSVLLIAAPDGYRSLLSYGELFLRPVARTVLIADQVDGKPLDNDGKFLFVITDDLAADREIKAVASIEVISLRPAPQASPKQPSFPLSKGETWPGIFKAGAEIESCLQQE